MLGEVLPDEAFGFMMVFVRFSALVFLMPALGDRSVPQRVRLSLGLALTLALFPVVGENVPGVPDTVGGMVAILLMEFITGMVIALAARILFVSTNIAGTVIAFQSGLAAAQNFDPSQGTQSALVSTLLTLVAVTLVFATDTHHLMIMGFANSYALFPVGEAIPAADFAGLVTHFISSTFRLGIQIAAPFIVYAFVFNLSLGLIAKLIPQFQVFFVGLPINILLGFALMSAVIGSMMMLFLEVFQAHLLQLVG